MGHICYNSEKKLGSNHVRVESYTGVLQPRADTGPEAEAAAGRTHGHVQPGQRQLLGHHGHQAVRGECPSYCQNQGEDNFNIFLLWNLVKLSKYKKCLIKFLLQKKTLS